MESSEHSGAYITPTKFCSCSLIFRKVGIPRIVLYECASQSHNFTHLNFFSSLYSEKKMRCKLTGNFIGERCHFMVQVTKLLSFKYAFTS